MAGYKGPVADVHGVTALQVLTLGGELLASAESLLRDGLHTSEVVEGYQRASAKVRGVLVGGKRYIQVHAHLRGTLAVRRNMDKTDGVCKWKRCTPAQGVLAGC